MVYFPDPVFGHITSYLLDPDFYKKRHAKVWQSIRPYRDCFFESAEHYCEFQCAFYCKTAGGDATAFYYEDVIEWTRDVRHLPVDVVCEMIDFADEGWNVPL